MREPSTDSSLLDRARNGDQTAFRHLVERYEQALSITVAGMLGTSSEVDDVVQEVFIRFYHALDSFRGESQVGTYLNRIAINRSIDVLRRRKRMRRRFFSIDESPEPAADEGASLEDREGRRLLRSAVDKLPEKYRAVVVMRMIREYSTEETAQILGIPYGTVLSRLSRAQDKLRKALEKGGLALYEGS